MDNKPGRIPLPSINDPPPTAPPPVPEPGSEAPLSAEQLEDKVVEVLGTCYDPEIPVNIYELGLVYGIDVSPEGAVHIRMTLTSPGCPVAGSLPGEIENKVKSVPGVSKAKVEVVWDPPWSPDRMSEAAKLQLGLF
jgi:FeS assembly SUF system protein